MTTLWLTLVLAAPPAALFAEANAAFDRGDAAHAAALYETLLSEGADSGWVYYDLGNACLRQHQLGRALAAYRRAEVRLPRDGDVRANLNFARTQTRDALNPYDPPALLRTLCFWHYGLNYHELTWAAVLANALFWLCAGVLAWRRELEVFAWMGTVSGIVLVALLSSLAVRSLNPTEVVIIARAEAEVHAATSVDSVTRFKLHEGTEAHVMDTQDGWTRVELSDGKQGWLQAGDTIRVTL